MCSTTSGDGGSGNEHMAAAAVATTTVAALPEVAVWVVLVVLAPVTAAGVV